MSLPANLAVMAGAGTGKTHRLISLCLDLLAGEEPGRRISPAQLCLLTFTEKAAAELRERLRRAVDALGDPALQRELDQAFVGTFHSLAFQLLAAAPRDLKLVPPGFELLDEQHSQELLEEVAERVVLDALDAGVPGVAQLVSRFELSGEWGLVVALVSALGKCREWGLVPGELAIGSEAAARSRFQAQLGQLRGLVSEVVGLDQELGGKLRETLEELRGRLARLSWESFEDRDGYPALEACLKADKRLPHQKNALKAPLAQLRAGILGTEEAPSLADLYGEARAVPFEAAFRGLLDRLAGAHAEQLRKLGCLDFAELMIRSRDLLWRHPAVRQQLHQRFRAVLVDEFQDTNSLQLELVCLLTERREGGPRSVETRAELRQLPLEPGLLVVVGDRKQSIYGFRGADVSVFEEMAAKIEAEGGRREQLQTNRRSRPQLLRFFNGVFRTVLAAPPDRRGFEVGYAPSRDDLQPPAEATSEPGSPIGVCWLRPQAVSEGEADRAAEAELLARWVKQQLGGGATIVDRSGARRPLEGRDIGILFRQLTHLEVYRQALVRHRIPHRIVRGAGFFGAQEVLDLASLLGLLADPEDSLALAGVLRSPWVTVSDDTLLALSLRAGGALTVDRLRAALAGPELPDGDTGRIRQLLDWLGPLLEQAEQGTASQLLRQALARSGFRLALSASPFPEQTLANLDKVLLLLERWERREGLDLARCADRLLRLIEVAPREAQAETVEWGDAKAVQLLTVHQSKGLEWPVVCIPELGAPLTAHGQPVRIDPQLGLATRAADVLEQPLPSARFDVLTAEERRREQAESLRLLYVALTRARDQLVLCGDGKSASSWAGRLRAALAADPSLEGAVARVSEAELPSPSTELPRREPFGAVLQAAASDLVARVRTSLPPAQPYVLTDLELAKLPRLEGRGVPLPSLPLAHPERRLALFRQALARTRFEVATRDAAARRQEAHRVVRTLPTAGHPTGAWITDRLERLLGSELGRAWAEASPGALVWNQRYRLALEEGLIVVGTLELRWRRSPELELVLAFHLPAEREGAERLVSVACLAAAQQAAAGAVQGARVDLDELGLQLLPPARLEVRAAGQDGWHSQRRGV